jgi:glycine cleavage system transcriptional repressor
MITLYGADRPGLVFGVSEAVASTGSNITDLRTRRFNSGRALYSLYVDVQLAPGRARDDLAARMTAVSRRFGVEIRLDDVPGADGL